MFNEVIAFTISFTVTLCTVWLLHVVDKKTKTKQKIRDFFRTKKNYYIVLWVVFFLSSMLAEILLPDGYIAMVIKYILFGFFMFLLA